MGDSLCSTFAIMAYLCTTISLQHLASDAGFILNNAAYASPGTIMRTRMHLFWCLHVCCARFSNYVGGRLPRLSSVSSAGLLWERWRANRSNEDALNCCKLTLEKKPDLKVRCTRCSVVVARKYLNEGWLGCSEASIPQCIAVWRVSLALATRVFFILWNSI